MLGLRRPLNGGRIHIVWQPPKASRAANAHRTWPHPRTSCTPYVPELLLTPQVTDACMQHEGKTCHQCHAPTAVPALAAIVERCCGGKSPTSDATLAVGL
eukprot:3186125-Amphidinium_carterae.1